MAIERWRPTREIRRLTEEMERLMEEALERRGRALAPGARTRFFPVNLYRKNNDLIVEALLPDVRPEDIDVSVTGRTLTLRAERKEAKEAREEDYYYREIEAVRYFRQLTLPEEVQADKAEARYENGTLRLRLPLAAAAKEARVEVKAA